MRDCVKQSHAGSRGYAQEHKSELTALEQTTGVVDEQHMDVLVCRAHCQEVGYYMPLHVQKLVWIRALEYVLGHNTAVSLLVVNMPTDAVVGRA